MEINGKIIKSFEEFKHLSPEERDFYIYTQLVRVGNLKEVVSGLDDKYASKKTEKIVYGAVGLILIAFAASLINIVMMNQV